MVMIGGREIGKGAPCFITFEAGATHTGLASAKRLVDYAALAHADAVKFQIIDPDRLVADKKQLFAYQVLVDRESGKTETVHEPLYELLRRRAMGWEEWKELKKYCDQLGMAFFATAGFEDEVAMLAKIGCDSIKIASADVNHLPLLRLAARTGLCLQIDTGSATIGEVEAAVDVISAEGNESIIIHHCPSGYPARSDRINLRVIQTLQQMFPYPIAFSDHTPGWQMDVAAVALGAKLIEKTITEDRLFRGVEHMMSLEPADMQNFVRTIREVEMALGGPRRLLDRTEREARVSVRRSIYLKESRPAGHLLTEEDCDYRRPGYGIPPSQLDSIVGKPLLVNKESGERLLWADISL